MNSEAYLRNLLSKVRLMLPEIAEIISEAEDRGDNREYARKRLVDVRQAADDAESCLPDSKLTGRILHPDYDLGAEDERLRIVEYLRSASNGSETVKYGNLFAEEIEAKEHLK